MSVSDDIDAKLVLQKIYNEWNTKSMIPSVTAVDFTLVRQALDRKDDLEESNKELRRVGIHDAKLIGQHHADLATARADVELRNRVIGYLAEGWAAEPPKNNTIPGAEDKPATPDSLVSEAKALADDVHGQRVDKWLQERP